MMITNKRAQSTVEYILLVTAVLAVMIAFATSKNSGLQGQLNTTLNTVAGDISTQADKLAPSHISNACKGTGCGTPVGFDVKLK